MTSGSLRWKRKPLGWCRSAHGALHLLLADEENEACLVMQDVEGNEFCLDENTAAIRRNAAGHAVAGRDVLAGPSRQPGGKLTRCGRPDESSFARRPAIRVPGTRAGSPA